MIGLRGAALLILSAIFLLVPFSPPQTRGSSVTEYGFLSVLSADLSAKYRGRAGRPVRSTSYSRNYSRSVRSAPRRPPRIARPMRPSSVRGLGANSGVRRQGGAMTRPTYGRRAIPTGRNFAGAGVRSAGIGRRAIPTGRAIPTARPAARAAVAPSRASAVRSTARAGRAAPNARKGNLGRQFAARSRIAALSQRPAKGSLSTRFNRAASPRAGSGGAGKGSSGGGASGGRPPPSFSGPKGPPSRPGITPIFNRAAKNQGALSSGFNKVAGKGFKPAAKAGARMGDPVSPRVFGQRLPGQVLNIAGSAPRGSAGRAASGSAGGPKISLGVRNRAASQPFNTAAQQGRLTPTFNKAAARPQTSVRGAFGKVAAGGTAKLAFNKAAPMPGRLGAAKAARTLKGPVKAKDTTLAQRALADAKKAAVADFRKGGGKVIAGGKTGTPVYKAQELARKYGGKPSDYEKVTSKEIGRGSNGTSVQVHAFRNRQTKQIVEEKLKWQGGRP